LWSEIIGERSLNKYKTKDFLVKHLSFQLFLEYFQPS